MMNTAQSCDNVNFSKTGLKLIRVLASSRFPVLLVEDSAFSQAFVLKLFPLPDEGGLSKAFIHEASMLNLVHPNLVTLHAAVPSFSFAEEDSNADPVSSIVMEHAVHGDLLRVLKHGSRHLSEEAVRTLFLQLLDGLEFMHSQGLAHLDLKPDNLFLGSNFELKIADFDQVTPIHDEWTSSRGTPGYRAPEVKAQTCQNLTAADIFSAGVVLFVMKSRVPPYQEGKLSGNRTNLYDELIQQENSKFWEIHSQYQKNDQFFSAPFRNLIEQMLHPDPTKRPTISEIRKSEWCCQPTLDQKSLKEELSRL